MKGNPWFKLAGVSLAGIVVSFGILWGIQQFSQPRYNYNGYQVQMNGNMGNMQMNGYTNIQGTMNMQGNSSMQSGMTNMQSGSNTQGGMMMDNMGMMNMQSNSGMQGGMMMDGM